METTAPVVTATTRRRIEAQGFLGLSDKTVCGIDRGLRTAPALCMVWTGIGTALASPAILGSLVPFALLGAALPGHPFDVLYHFGLRRLFGGEPLPPYPLPRRFACLLASLFLTATAGCFLADLPTAGYAVGFSLTAAASVNVTTGFCIPSFVYGLLFGRPGGGGK